MQIAGMKVKCGNCSKPIESLDGCFSFAGWVACEKCLRLYYRHLPEEEFTRELGWRHREALRVLSEVERKRRGKGFVSGPPVMANVNKPGKRGSVGLGPRCDFCGSSRHDSEDCTVEE